MALKYVVTKRVFGFDKTNTEKYVAKSVGSGKMNFDKMCEKVSRLCGIHRKVVDLVVSGLVPVDTDYTDGSSSSGNNGSGGSGNGGEEENPLG